MNAWRNVAAKELRTYFLSPVALIFIATFLLASLFSFFWVEGFFVRGSADIRPLFKWLPLLLAFLVPALGMRLWAEEEKAGTLELLMTFPVTTWSAVGWISWHASPAVVHFQMAPQHCSGPPS